MVGTTIAHYRVTARLGAGGMGEVYRATDTKLARDVALKVLKPEVHGDTTARQRLLREARAAAALNHPNICTVHEVGEDAGQAYIVMEFVEGRPLHELIPPKGLPAETVLRYACQVAAALAHAHERGLIHRDLKASNVVITPAGHAKVLDFGLAKRLQEADRDAETATVETLTAPGTTVGTLAYMSPEQLRGQPADERSDVWALGILLYEMVKGTRPFGGKTSFELSAAILNHPAADLGASTPAELRAVIERCLAREPERRYTRGGELLAALQAIQAGTSSHPSRVASPFPQRLWPLALAAVVVLAVAMSAYYLPSLRGRFAASPAGPRLESLAVLPLENLSGDPAQAYFADGMTDAVINELASFQGLKKVIARSSVMRFRDTTKAPREIAQELQVDALVTGTVLRAGDRVRITVQLINPENGQQLWGSPFERNLRDVLTLQSEVSRAIAKEIRIKVSPVEQARGAETRPVNPEAYEAVLKARFFRHKLTLEGFKVAADYCRFALEKDPKYAPAYSSLGAAVGGPAHMGFVPPFEVAPQVKEALQKAVDLDASSSDARVRLAVWALLLDWDWSRAEEEFRKAGEISAEERISVVDLYLIQGRRDEAYRELQHILELDPLNSWTHTAVGGRFLRLGRYDEGIALLERAESAEPMMGLAHRYLWTAYHHKGQAERALAEAKQFWSVQGHPEIAEALQRGSAKGGYARSMQLAANAAAAGFAKSYVQPSEIARLFLYAGDKDHAMQWLEKAFQVRDTWMVFLKDDPRFDELRSDARFQNLLRQMKFPA